MTVGKFGVLAALNLIAGGENDVDYLRDVVVTTDYVHCLVFGYYCSLSLFYYAFKLLLLLPRKSTYSNICAKKHLLLSDQVPIRRQQCLLLFWIFNPFFGNAMNWVFMKLCNLLYQKFYFELLSASRIDNENVCILGKLFDMFSPKMDESFNEFGL